MNHSFDSFLWNKERRDAFFLLIEQCSGAQEYQSLLEVMHGPLRTLFEHDYSAFGLAGVNEPKVRFSANLGYPQDYINLTVDVRTGTIRCPLMLHQFRLHRPVYADPDNVHKFYKGKWLKSFHDSELRNIVVHGITELSGDMLSYFTFSRLSNRTLNASEAIASACVPHLHAALVRLLPYSVGQDKGYEEPLLSKREREILQWVYAGKTNALIGEKLSISQYTVKTHLQNINRKLGVANRTQAVAEALNRRLINI